MDYPIKEKVLAYIIRQNGDRRQLLVFDHVDFPDAGTQVPAGTVDAGESPDAAVLREAFEEAGVSGLELVRYLGTFPWVYEEMKLLHHRHVYHLALTQPTPEEWLHIVSDGEGDKGMRFKCFWMDVADAAGTLAGEQGIYLQHLDE